MNTFAPQRPQQGPAEGWSHCLFWLRGRLTAVSTIGQAQIV